MKGETMQAEGQHEKYYDLTAEINPGPGVYYPAEEEASDAYAFTFGHRWFPDQQEMAAMMQADEACNRCPIRGDCDAAYSEDAVGCGVDRRMTQ